MPAESLGIEWTFIKRGIFTVPKFKSTRKKANTFCENRKRILDKMETLSSKILYRIKLKLNEINESYNTYINLKGSREKANKIWLQLQAKNGRTVVNRQLLNEIKLYCQRAFGSKDYWPWLAVYTELTGEFKEGWMPDEYYRFKFLNQMNPEKFVDLSEAKTIDYKLFNDSIVEPLFFRMNGYYCNKDGAVISKTEVSDILSDLDEELIIKPDSSHGGMGITFKHANELEVEELPGNSDLLFQTVQKQHAELNRLYGHSINTFRVLTCIDNEGTVGIKFIYLRFGRAGNRVDNGVSGGGWVFVHVDGAVEPVAYDSHGIDLGTHHQDTGTEFASLELPFLPNVLRLCKSTHQTFPYFRIIAWDVFIDSNGEARFIEWNTNYPGFWAMEARYGPFFADEIM